MHIAAKGGKSDRQSCLRAMHWETVFMRQTSGMALTSACLGAGSTADAPRNYSPEGDPIPKMFNAFNGLGIMVCSSSHQFTPCHTIHGFGSKLSIRHLFLGNTNAVILSDLYRSPKQDLIACRLLHTEYPCSQVSFPGFLERILDKDCGLFKVTPDCSCCSV